MSIANVFTYQDLFIDAESQTIRCHYDAAGEHFCEQVTIPGADLNAPGVRHAATLYFLLAGVSYYKTNVPPIIDLGSVITSEAEQVFLREFFLQGLGEFAFKNELDLSELTISGQSGPITLDDPGLDGGDILIPFGGGIDSIVTVAELAGQARRAALFVAERPGARFTAIEEPAALTGLSILRAERLIDFKLLESSRGYLNGHVPVTGILSALAVLTAVSSGYGAVAMSNEHSASSATIERSSGPLNHQWSKGIAFERGFRSVLAQRLGSFEYFSYLRSRSELDIARSFAQYTRFHQSFRSCNRAFHQDPSRRLETWCGVCDKCLFVDLVLAPFLSRDTLAKIFGGAEPLENTALSDQLEILVGAGEGNRPFECVGDEDECREALTLVAHRKDRQRNTMLQALATRVSIPVLTPTTPDESYVPERYATRHRLV